MAIKAPNNALISEALINNELVTHDLVNEKRCNDELSAEGLSTELSTQECRIDELGAQLVRYLATNGWSYDDAHDLAQEAMLRVHKFQQSQTLDNARAYLFKTANNLAIDQIRRTHLHDKYLRSEMPADQEEDNYQFAPSPERTAAAKQELDNIYAVVDKMPTKVKRAFLLNRDRDLSYSEIAKEMGVSNSMVEKYITEALKVLRQQIPR
ncbi:MAG: RNA polymerase sigma factor (sigma-70 family) [Candidatus Paceibacteria bacterium]|jgi:RNA polymerase sigma factor (sigma-70 family)